MKLDPHLSSSRTFSTSSPQGCALSPLLYSLYARITEWCSADNLLLNSTKTKEIILDFRKNKAHLAPLFINGDCVERVNTFKLLGRPLLV